MIIAGKPQDKPLAESGHYYARDGQPAYGSGMKEVRSRGLVPSITTIQSDDRAWALETWKLEQVALNCWDNPGHGMGDEVRDAWVEARVEQSREATKAFADFGTEYHDGAEAILNGANWDRNDPWLIEFDKWAQANVVQVFWTEKCLVHPTNLYAGRADAFIEHQEHGAVLVDYKTRKLRQLKSGKFSCAGCRYDKDIEQLAGYADCLDTTPRVMNIYVHREAPAEPVPYLWPEEVQAYWLESMMLAAERWTLKHKYDPRDWKPEEGEVSA